MNDEIQALKTRVSIERVLSHFNQTVHSNKKCQCPWHGGDNTPSLHIYPDRAFCFACGKSADIFDITEKFTGLTNFREQKGYLMRTFMNADIPPTQNHLADRKEVRDVCNSEAISFYYQSAIRIIVHELNSYTQDFLAACNNIPAPYQDFFKERFLNTKCLIESDFFQDNILFLHSRKELIRVLKRQLPYLRYEWQKCGLFKENGSLCLLYEWSFCLLVPIHTIQSNTIVPTTILVRNIDPKSKYKDFYFITGQMATQHIEHVGFAGLQRAFDLYPENVKNFCDGLTVVLAEGITDFISAHILSQQFNIFGGSNEKIVILTSGGVSNTIKESNLQLIKNCARLIIAFDRDEAGETGFARVKTKASRIGFKSVEQFRFSPDFEGKDLNDFLIAHKERNFT